MTPRAAGAGPLRTLHGYCLCHTIAPGHDGQERNLRLPGVTVAGLKVTFFVP
jgi:hypothetical protein